MENYTKEQAIDEIGRIVGAVGFLGKFAKVWEVLDKLEDSIITQVRHNLVAGYVVDNTDWDAAEEYADQILGDLSGHD
jgi:hypothetical protein